MINGQWNPVLDIPEGVSGKFRIEHFHTEGDVKAFNLRTTMYGQEQRTIHFEGKRKWHRLCEGKNGVWMTDLPIEQVQHDDQMEPIRGSNRVLVGGLGLGYALTKLVLDYDVDEIDVVEINPDVTKLVWPHLDERVRNRCRRWDMDLFHFIKQKAIPGDYHAAFYDIWQSDGEATFHDIVIPLRKLSAELTDNIVCWNEDIMRGQLLQQLTMRFMFNSRPTGFPEPLKQFCLTTDDKFHRWAIPFWRTFFDEKIKPDKFAKFAKLYVCLYETTEGWLKIWERAVEQDIDAIPEV